MRASYQGSKILNKFPIKKLAQYLNYFCKNCCFETLSFSKKRDTSVTHINLPVSFFFGSPPYTGSPSEKLNSPRVEPLMKCSVIFRQNANQI